MLDAAIEGLELEAPIGVPSREEGGPATRRGVPRRYMIFMPPGGAKSTYGSILAPAYIMGRLAAQKPIVLACSHSDDLARRFGRKVKARVNGARHRRLFDQRLASDAKSDQRWELRGRGGEVAGEYYCAGVGAGIAGFRATAGIIDDPIRKREDVESENLRNKQWDWYQDDFEPRTLPDAIIGIKVTRWHEDDLPGRILGRKDPNNPDRVVPQAGFDFSTGWHKAYDGQWWYVIVIPAQHEEGFPDDPLGRKPGEYYWPEFFRPEIMEARKRGSRRRWTSLFQQRPSPPEGSFFQKPWIKYYPYEPKAPNRGAPARLTKYGASDYATTEDGGDWTEEGVCGVDGRGAIYILDWWLGQRESNSWIDAELDLQRRHKPDYWGFETGQIAKAIEPFRRVRALNRRIFCPRFPLPSVASKTTRAKAIQGMFHDGLVLLPGGDLAPPWVAELERQLLAFPAGARDDGVDVLSCFGRMVDHFHGPAEERVEEPENEPVAEDDWFGGLTIGEMIERNARRLGAGRYHAGNWDV